MEIHFLPPRTTHVRMLLCMSDGSSLVAPHVGNKTQRSSATHGHVARMCFTEMLVAADRVHEGDVVYQVVLRANLSKVGQTAEHGLAMRNSLKGMDKAPSRCKNRAPVAFQGLVCF